MLSKERRNSPEYLAKKAEKERLAREWISNFPQSGKGDFSTYFEAAAESKRKHLEAIAPTPVEYIPPEAAPFEYNPMIANTTRSKMAAKWLTVSATGGTAPYTYTWTKSSVDDADLFWEAHQGINILPVYETAGNWQFYGGPLNSGTITITCTATDSTGLSGSTDITVAAVLGDQAAGVLTNAIGPSLCPGDIRTGTVYYSSANGITAIKKGGTVDFDFVGSTNGPDTGAYTGTYKENGGNSTGLTFGTNTRYLKIGGAATSAANTFFEPYWSAVSDGKTTKNPNIHCIILA